MPAPPKPMTGLKLGRLTVMAMAGSDNSGARFWSCRCECGGTITTRGSSLRRGHVRSCGCLRQAPSVGHDRKYPTSLDAARAFNFNQYRRNAKVRDVEWDLTFERFREISEGNCRYCGDPPQWRLPQRCRSGVFASGIDRVNNALGYVEGNVASCCTWCNRAKTDLGAEDFVQRCLRVAANASIARNE